MKRINNNIIYLRDILQAINNISKHSELRGTHTADQAVTLEIIIAGEAASKISSDFKQKYPELPWREMSDTRNKLVHDYWDVDYRIVWDIACDFLPGLKEPIEKILQREQKNG